MNRPPNSPSSLDAARVPSTSPNRVASSEREVDASLAQLIAVPSFSFDFAFFRLTESTSDVAASERPRAVFASISKEWNRFGDVRELPFEGLGRMPTADRSVIERDESRSSRNEQKDSVVMLTDDGLWADFGEGGFIELDAVEDLSAEPSDSGDNALTPSGTRSSNVRDELWFGFRHRLDLLDALDLDEDRMATETAEDLSPVWLLEEGGMIVLTSAHFGDEHPEPQSRNVAEARSDGTASGETEIILDESIEVFQVMEVATSPATQHEQTPPPTENESVSNGHTVGEDRAAQPADQAATSTEQREMEPIRGTSTPLLLVLATLFHRHQRKRRETSPASRQV